MSEEAHQVFDRIADGYASNNPHYAARAEYEWPMVRSLLPDLEGRSVLDAATGAGYYAARIAERGASVVGIDASEAMIERARSRHGESATFQQADLRDPLPFTDGRFDLVLSQLTLEHLRDWDPVIGEFARVLEAGGQLVLSTDHPFCTYFTIEHEGTEIGSALTQRADYYAIEAYERDWGTDETPLHVPFVRRPLVEVVRPLFEAGFVLTALREPAPDADEEPMAYFDDELPRFLGLRATLADER